MSNELQAKARNAFRELVELNDEEKMFLDDGQLVEIFEREKERRQTFEYVKNISNVEHK